MYRSKGNKQQSISILPQPNDVTCGPTCLHALYRYYGIDIALIDVIDQVKQIKGGGTLGVMLGNHALKMGFDVSIYTYNLHMFDPSWFYEQANLLAKLEEQEKYKLSRKFRQASDAYKQFLDSGGHILFEELSENLIRGFLERNQPILTGLSATYLYHSKREIPEFNFYHDVKGEPSGHFVVLSGYDEEKRKVWIADPLTPNPIHNKVQNYAVDMTRLINSILLGIVTYDANLLVITPSNTIKKNK